MWTFTSDTGAEEWLVGAQNFFGPTLYFLVKPNSEAGWVWTAIRPRSR